MQQEIADFRKAPRKEILAPAVMHIDVHGKIYRSQAIVRNLSTEGLLVALYDFDEEIKNVDLENLSANIRFRCPDSDREYTASCRTKRAEKLTYSVQIGAVFTEMNPEQILAMQHYFV